MIFRFVKIFLFVAFLLDLSRSKTINDEVIIRFYQNFGQVYRQSEEIPNENGSDVVRFRYIFPSEHFRNISEESISISSTEILRRTIRFYRNPSIDDVGSLSLYEFYFPNKGKQLISCVNRRWNPFRRWTSVSVEQFQCSSTPKIEPFYEVIFECRKQNHSNPLLSYNDRSVYWNARYELEISPAPSETSSVIKTFADLRNDAGSTFLVRDAELISGDVSIDQNIAPRRASFFETTENSFTPFEDTSSGIYVNHLSLERRLELPPKSVQSVPFLNAKVNVEPYLIYLSTFTPSKSSGKLQRVYELSTVDVNLPAGKLIIREDDRMVSQQQLPQLTIGERIPLRIGFDSDVLYRRNVHLINATENGSSMTYHVEYSFEDRHPSRNVSVRFTENFLNHQNIRLQPISNKIIEFVNNEVQGNFIISGKSKPITFSYNITIFKSRQSN